MFRSFYLLVLPLYCLASGAMMLGCQGSTEVVSEAKIETASEKTYPGYPLTVVDALDRKVTFQKPPQRIISLSPSNTELLFSIGLDDRIVAVTNLCDYPPATNKKEKVGDFNSISISIEKIIALKPDLVVSGSGFHKQIVSTLENLDVTVLAVEPENFAGIYSSLKQLGKICHVEEESEKLVTRLVERVQFIRERAAEVKPSPPLKVFYQVWKDPISTVGNVSYIGEMLDVVGVENIFGELNTSYSPISEEVLLTRNPDVILVPQYHGGAEDRDEILNRKNWEGITAVKNNRVEFLPDDEVSRYGPRFVEGIEAIFKACYPEASLER